MSRIRQHLTYGNVMVTILAFIVLTGGTAAALSGSNTVFTDDVADDSQPAGGGNPVGGLISADLRRGSVRTSEILNNSITRVDVPNLVFHTLTLKNGWEADCGGRGAPAIATSVEGVVYFRGEMCRTSGSSTNPFVVPPGTVPDKNEFMPVSLASGGTGQLQVSSNGEVFVSDDPNQSGAAAASTELAGASYTLPY